MIFFGWRGRVCWTGKNGIAQPQQTLKLGWDVVPVLFPWELSGRWKWLFGAVHDCWDVKLNPPTNSLTKTCYLPFVQNLQCWEKPWHQSMPWPGYPSAGDKLWLGALQELNCSPFHAMADLALTPEILCWRRDNWAVVTPMKTVPRSRLIQFAKVNAFQLVCSGISFMYVYMSIQFTVYCHLLY